MIDFITMVRQLSNIQRCATTRRIKNQSVAEHSFYVAIIALLIAEELKLELSIGTLLQKAIFHDMEEAITGDIIYPLKHSSVQTNHFFNEAIGEYCRQVFKNHFPDFEQYRAIQKYSKTGAEGEVIKLADAVELVLYCQEEVSSGNRHMQGVLNKGIEIAENCKLYEKCKSIKKLIKQIKGGRKK